MAYTYNQSSNGLLDLSNPATTIEMMKQDVIEQPANLLAVNPNTINLSTGSSIGNPDQARVDAFFNKMTPAELSAYQTRQSEVINSILTPTFVKILADMVSQGGLSVGTTPGAAGTGVGYGGTAASGMSGMGFSAGAPSGQSASNSGSGEGGMNAGGGGRGAPGASTGTGVGVGSGATTSGSTSVSSNASVGGLSAGGSGGSSASGTGCCFIMLEARYGDGTMDTVVRRYRNEKITDRNKRGYYKLAEVFVPLMRESKLFKFMVAKTFADPLVSYGKWHYGQNKYGWIFKPVEKFWMNVFNVLGTDTQFIRENGQTV
jgi:hypothetical protein